MTGVFDYFDIADLLHVPELNVFHALIAVVVTSALIWAVSAHDSPVHKLAFPVVISAAAATAIMVLLRAISRLM